jgi:hypothetical protein
MRLGAQIEAMRNPLISLLLLAATATYGGQTIHPQSPTFSATIATQGVVCLYGINHAQAVTDAGDGATYAWRVTNGTIMSGQGTPSITFTVAETGTAVISLTIEWGMTLTMFRPVPVLGPPSILRQPQSAAIPAGTAAVLSVAASDDALSYDWFEGRVGDTSKLVLASTTEFRTPPLTKTTSYWVRVGNRCGTVNSQAALVTVNTKRRSAGH